MQGCKGSDVGAEAKWGSQRGLSIRTEVGQEGQAARSRLAVAIPAELEARTSATRLPLSFHGNRIYPTKHLKCKEIILPVDSALRDHVLCFQPN